MTLVPPQDGPLGPLHIDEVFFAHDGPRLFSARSPSGTTFLGLCVDEDHETLTYLYIQIGEQPLRQLKYGAMPLLDAVMQTPSGRVLLVESDYSEDPHNRYEWIDVGDIPDDFLPLEGAGLNVQSENAQAFSLEELRADARSQSRSTVALELTRANTTTNEFPIHALGRIAESLQVAVNALAQEVGGREPTSRGRVPEDLTSQVELHAYSVRAASFVLLMGTSNQGRLFAVEDLASATLERFAGMVAAASNSRNLAASLDGIGTRARNRFRDFLSRVHESGSGITFTATDGYRDQTGSLSVKQVGEAVETMDREQVISTQITVEGVLLTSLSLTRRTFEVRVEGSNRTYSGSVDPSALPEVDGLTVSTADQFYTVWLIEERHEAADEDLATTKYTLVRIEATS